VPPLYDRSWDDNTLLILTYAHEHVASGKTPAINLH